jgi:group I intron endonuclease
MAKAIRKPTVYTITNDVSGRVYVGSTCALRSRWAKHRADLRAGQHANLGLQADWIAHGEGAFRFEAVEYPAEVDLGACEAAWFRRFGTEAAGLYNSREPRRSSGAATVPDAALEVLTLGQWRQRRLLTIGELAEKAGVCRSTLRIAEQRGHMRGSQPATKRKLAMALGVEIDAVREFRRAVERGDDGVKRMADLLDELIAAATALRAVLDGPRAH